MSQSRKEWWLELYRKIKKVAFTVWVIVFSILVGLGIRDNRNAAKAGQETHKAVCVLKTDYKHRIMEQKKSIAGAELFVKEHPGGFAGIPVSALNVNVQNKQDTLDNLKSTLRSLGAVKCD